MTEPGGPPLRHGRPYQVGYVVAHQIMYATRVQC